MNNYEHRAFYDYLRDQHHHTRFRHDIHGSRLECTIFSLDGLSFSGQVGLEKAWDEYAEEDRDVLRRAAFRRAFRNVLEHIRYVLDEEYELTHYEQA